MKKKVAIGIQDFEKIREKNCFYIDKTSFMKEWWENEDDGRFREMPRDFFLDPQWPLRSAELFSTLKPFVDFINYSIDE